MLWIWDATDCAQIRDIIDGMEQMIFGTPEMLDIEVGINRDGPVRPD